MVIGMGAVCEPKHHGLPLIKSDIAIAAAKCAPHGRRSNDSPWNSIKADALLQVFERFVGTLIIRTMKSDNCSDFEKDHKRLTVINHQHKTKCECQKAFLETCGLFSDRKTEKAEDQTQDLIIRTAMFQKKLNFQP